MFKNTLIAATAVIALTIYTAPANASTETGVAPVTQAADKPCFRPGLKECMDKQKEEGHLHAVYTGVEADFLYFKSFGSAPEEPYDEIRVYSHEKYPNVIYIGIRKGCYAAESNRIPKEHYMSIIDLMKGKEVKGERGA